MRHTASSWWILLAVAACASKEPQPEPQAAAPTPASADVSTEDELSDADKQQAAAAGEVSEANLGKQVVLKGWAVDRKGGAVLVTDDDVHVWIDGLDSWPEGFYRGGDRGKRLRVTGTLDQDHGLPVFVPKEGEPIPQGVPVPEGTDLDEASKRFVLRNATW